MNYIENILIAGKYHIKHICPHHNTHTLMFVDIIEHCRPVSLLRFGGNY